MAGLWEHWEGEGSSIESCAIITTRANDLMAEIHDRMPVILSPETTAHWLHAKDRPAQELTGLLTPCPSDWLCCHEVSRAVNNPHHQGARLIEAIEQRPELGA